MIKIGPSSPKNPPSVSSSLPPPSEKVETKKAADVAAKGPKSWRDVSRRGLEGKDSSKEAGPLAPVSPISPAAMSSPVPSPTKSAQHTTLTESVDRAEPRTHTLTDVEAQIAVVAAASAVSSTAIKAPAPASTAPTQTSAAYPEPIALQPIASGATASTLATPAPTAAPAKEKKFSFNPNAKEFTPPFPLAASGQYVNPDGTLSSHSPPHSPVSPVSPYQHHMGQPYPSPHAHAHSPTSPGSHGYTPLLPPAAGPHHGPMHGQMGPSGYYMGPPSMHHGVPHGHHGHPHTVYPQYSVVPVPMYGAPVMMPPDYHQPGYYDGYGYQYPHQ